MDSPVFLIILSIFFIGFVAISYFLLTQIKKIKEDVKGDSEGVLMEWLKDMKSSVEKSSEMVQKQLTDQRNTLDQSLKNQSDTLHNQLKGQREAMNEQTKLIWQRLDNAQDVIRNVQTQLGGIQEFGKDIKDLSNVLKSPKLRGGLGEQFLYDVLANSLPQDLYKTQYKFKDGNICDAVILTSGGIIPIDAKFSMENFKLMLTCETEEDRDKARKAFFSDVKKRIDEISSKYILPEEGTVEQAVMYIPAENVYYEIILNFPQLEDYCRQKGVFVTSPNTFSSFLKVILAGYQKHQLQKHAGDILKALAGIKIEAEKFSDELCVLEKHVSNSYKSMDNVKAKYNRLFGKIEGAHQLEEKEQMPLLE